MRNHNPNMRNTKAALQWIVTILRKHKIPFQISGGFAARVYGSKRKLADIDIEIPEKDFQKIVPDVRKYIQFGPKIYKDHEWDTLFMKLKYKGQNIEFDGAYKRKMFSAKTKKWINIRSDYSKAKRKRVYGMLVPIISKDHLIKHKKILMRKVDKEDLKYLENREQNSSIVKKGYTKIAQAYHKQRDRYVNDTLLKKFAKNVEKGSKVLDLGCGAGVPVAKFLSRNGYKVTGVDFAEGMIKLARKNVPNAKFIRMDMTKMKFPANSFDGAVSFYAIIHVPREKHAKIYRDLHRVLKPGAVIFVNASGSDSWEGYNENYLGVKMFWSFYGPKKTLRIIKDSGFKILWKDTLRIGGETQFWVMAENKK